MAKSFVPVTVLGIGLVLVAASSAGAQSLSTNSASFNAGYGRVAGQENRAVAAGTRDANGNRVIVDGIMLNGSDQSLYTRQSGSGAYDSYSGVGGQGSSSAIGNNLVVITQGNYNTVIIDSTQINNGNVTAGSGTSGGVGGPTNGN